MAERHDVTIVGGGIVGLATALALVEAGRTVLVLEAGERVASQQTGHNSGVIHSGLYYRPGSLKARTCADGREAMYAFCAQEGVPVKRCGKLVVATREAELATLGVLEERGRANGLRGLSRLSGEDVRRLEPAVAGLQGLWVEETGVVNFVAVAEAMAAKVRQLGAEVRVGARVLGIQHQPDAIRIATRAASEATRLVVNCAGLASDRVARLAGVDPGVAIIPFRGEYYEVRPERAGLIRNLIYPVPDPELPFLGVHFTRRIDGRVEAGPNAVLALQRDAYRRWALSPRDALAIVTYPGFWRMAARWWRTGIAEMGRSLSKRLFVQALRRLVPSLQADDLRWGGCGIRAQAVDATGRLLDDFHIVEGERSVHLVNAPSPAATASLSIGRQLAQRVTARLDQAGGPA